MEREEFVPLFKQSCYRLMALNGIDIVKLAMEQEADEGEEIIKVADDAGVKKSLVDHFHKALTDMGLDLGTTMMFAAAPAVAGVGAGYAAEKLTAPPTVSLRNARSAELADAYDRAINEVKTRIDVRKRRAGLQ